MRLLVDLAPCIPARGLAIEEVLLDSARSSGVEILRLWRNRQSLILGRSQSMVSEVDVARASNLQIPILRRVSGGGTVYHDPGNLNISVFASKRPWLSDVASIFAFFGRLVAESLACHVADVTALDNGLYIGHHKIGGAAQAHRGVTFLYHTTLLVQSPSVPMESLLLAMRPGYDAKGIASRPRCITSLSSHSPRLIEPDDLLPSIVQALASGLGVEMNEDALSQEEAVRADELRVSKYGSAQWNDKI